MTRVIVYPPDLDAIGSYRLLYPAWQLRQHTDLDVRLGIHVQERMQDGNRLVLFSPQDEIRLQRPDMIVLGDPLETAHLDTLLAAREVGAKVIVDVDDYYRGPKKTGGAWSPGRNPTALHAIMGQADAVTVTTPALKDAYRATNPTIIVLPNSLDWDTWQEREPEYHKRRERLRVGWLGVMGWGRRPDVRQLAGVLDVWLRQHPHVDFVAAGERAVHEQIGTPPAQRISFCARAFADGHLPDLLQFDIGLIPLEPGVFNECKSTLKGLEYGAAGIPWISSPTQEYGRLVARAPLGAIASRPRDWTGWLDRLLQDDVRRSMGKNGRRLAQDTAIQNQWPRWERAYKQVLAAPHRSPVGPRPVTRLLEHAIRR